HERDAGHLLPDVALHRCRNAQSSHDQSDETHHAEEPCGAIERASQRWIRFSVITDSRTTAEVVFQSVAKLIDVAFLWQFQEHAFRSAADIADDSRALQRFS